MGSLAQWKTHFKPSSFIYPLDHPSSRQTVLSRAMQLNFQCTVASNSSLPVRFSQKWTLHVESDSKKQLGHALIWTEDKGGRVVISKEWMEGSEQWQRAESEKWGLTRIYYPRDHVLNLYRPSLLHAQPFQVDWKAASLKKNQIQEDHAAPWMNPPPIFPHSAACSHVSDSTLIQPPLKFLALLVIKTPISGVGVDTDLLTHLSFSVWLLISQHHSVN